MNKGNLLFAFEALWWVVTIVVIWAIHYPLWHAMQVWPFQSANVVFIVALITLTRYTFLLPYTYLAKQQFLKAAVMVLLVPLTFYLVANLNAFLVFIEEKTWAPITGHLPEGERQQIEAYGWNEMIFFGAGSIIAAPVLAGRLLMSIWRTHNRGTV